jgi:hypothetical protein
LLGDSDLLRNNNDHGVGLRGVVLYMYNAFCHFGRCYCSHFSTLSDSDT